MVFFVTLFYRPDFCRMILLCVLWTVLFTILFWREIIGAFFWKILFDFFSAMVFFVTLFYRSDFSRMILLLVFWTVSFTILFRRDDFTADYVSWFFVGSTFLISFFYNFWIFDFCEIYVICPNLWRPTPPLVSYIKADFWGRTPPLSFIHYEKCMQGGPPTGRVKGVGVWKPMSASWQPPAWSKHPSHLCEEKRSKTATVTPPQVCNCCGGWA